MEEMNIVFKIIGNPVPYLRMTQGQVKLMHIPDHKLSIDYLKKKDRIRRYFEWKRWVRNISLNHEFPRKPTKKIYLNVMIYFSNKKHADPENIRKGIQDALFDNDKLVAGSVDFDYNERYPHCVVTIRNEKS